MANYLVVGASRGLGALFSRLLPAAGDTAWLVSRSRPESFEGDGVRRIWIQADLTTSESGSQIAGVIGDLPLDVCLYNAGIWETLAFTDRYDYEQAPDAEIERIVQVNLTSAITCIRKLLPALRRSANAKVIFIGSNAGLENSKRPEAAYTASKFGLRGLTHALREIVRPDSIAVTCLNLGDVGSVTSDENRVDADSSGRALIMPADIIVMLKAVIALSKTSCVKEIDLFAMTDTM